MKKTFFLGGAAMLAIGTAALAQPGGDRDGPKTRADVATSIDARFARTDANRDGVLTEADRAARHAQRFAKLDADNNGELTEAELKAGHEARRDDMQARRAEHRADRPEPTAEQKAKWAERRAKHADKRGDRQENRVARLDADGNGSLNAAEWAAKAERPGRADDAAANGRRGDGHHGRRGMDMMKMADANGDNAISLDEMRNAALARFDKVDTDGDGTISAAERQAAREAHKAQRAPKQAG